MSYNKLVNGEIVPMTAEEIVARQAEEAAANAAKLAAHLPAYRERKILDGITINGLALGGDDKTMLRVAGARIKADADPNFTTKWNGVTELNAAAIIAISDAMLTHVDKCFKAYGAVDPADYTTTEQIEAAFDAAYSEL